MRGNALRCLVLAHCNPRIRRLLSQPSFIRAVTRTENKAFRVAHDVSWQLDFVLRTRGRGGLARRGQC